jgi:hypothetical protein
MRPSIRLLARTGSNYMRLHEAGKFHKTHKKPVARKQFGH